MERKFEIVVNVDESDSVLFGVRRGEHTLELNGDVYTKDELKILKDLTSGADVSQKHTAAFIEAMLSDDPDAKIKTYMTELEEEKKKRKAELEQEAREYVEEYIALPDDKKITNDNRYLTISSALNINYHVRYLAEKLPEYKRETERLLSIIQDRKKNLEEFDASIMPAIEAYKAGQGPRPSWDGTWPGTREVLDLILEIDKKKYEDDRNNWIRKNGSERLQKILEHGYIENSDNVYLEERLESECPGWEFTDLYYEDIINPTLEELEALEEAKKLPVENPTLVFVSEEGDYYEGTEDRKLVYVTADYMEREVSMLVCER